MAKPIDYALSALKRIEAEADAFAKATPDSLSAEFCRSVVVQARIGQSWAVTCRLCGAPEKEHIEDHCPPTPDSRNSTQAALDAAPLLLQINNEAEAHRRFSLLRVAYRSAIKNA